MTNLDFPSQNLFIHFQNLPSFIVDGFEFGISVIRNHPKASLASVNFLFFIAMNAIAQELETRIQESGKSFEGKDKLFEEILIDYVIFGIAFFTFNLSIERAALYPLGTVIRTAITVTAIAMRIFIRSISETED